VGEALAYAGHAPQSPNRLQRRPELETLLGPADATPESEDCLTLRGFHAAGRSIGQAHLRWSIDGVPDTRYSTTAPGQAQHRADPRIEIGR
jgi:hypothetical protein